MTFGQLILRKIIKTVTIRIRLILRLKCTKIDIGYSTPPDVLAGIEVLLLREGVQERGRGMGGDSPYQY